MGGLVEQDNWQRVRYLFDQVCDLPAEQWEPRLHPLSSDAWVVDERLRLLQAQAVELGTVRERIGSLIRQVDQAELGAGDRSGPGSCSSARCAVARGWSTWPSVPIAFTPSRWRSNCCRACAMSAPQRSW